MVDVCVLSEQPNSKLDLDIAHSLRAAGFTVWTHTLDSEEQRATALELAAAAASIAILIWRREPFYQIWLNGLAPEVRARCVGIAVGARWPRQASIAGTLEVRPDERSIEAACVQITDYLRREVRPGAPDWSQAADDVFCALDSETALIAHVERFPESPFRSLLGPEPASPAPTRFQFRRAYADGVEGDYEVAAAEQIWRQVQLPRRNKLSEAFAMWARRVPALSQRVARSASHHWRPFAVGAVVVISAFMAASALPQSQPRDTVEMSATLGAQNREPRHLPPTEQLALGTLAREDRVQVVRAPPVARAEPLTLAGSIESVRADLVSSSASASLAVTPASVPALEDDPDGARGAALFPTDNLPREARDTVARARRAEVEANAVALRARNQQSSTLVRRASLVSGASYDGEQRAGIPSGRGRSIWPDGATYAGAWRNGRPEGYGVYRFADGRGYAGEFAAGAPTANGVFWGRDGRLLGESMRFQALLAATAQQRLE